MFIHHAKLADIQKVNRKVDLSIYTLRCSMLSKDIIKKLLFYSVQEDSKNVASDLQSIVIDPKLLHAKPYGSNVIHFGSDGIFCSFDDTLSGSFATLLDPT